LDPGVKATRQSFHSLDGRLVRILHDDLTAAEIKQDPMSIRVA
jgi:hypothetical protein